MQVYNVKELCVFFTIFFPYLTKAKKKSFRKWNFLKAENTHAQPTNRQTNKQASQPTPAYSDFDQITKSSKNIQLLRLNRFIHFCRLQM